MSRRSGWSTIRNRGAEAMAGVGRGRQGGRRGPGGGALAASLVLHVAFVGVVLAAGLVTPSPLPPLKVYRVNIVSPPPLESGPPQPVVVNPPEVARPREEEPAPPQPQPKPEPKPAPKAPPKADPKPEKAPPKAEEKPKTEARTEPAKDSEPAKPPARPRGANPKPDAKVGGEGLNIQIDGEAFPFPDYLENILVQISRYFRWTGPSGLKAEVYFVILRDGSVDDIRILQGSGDVAFNLEAMAAIEQAGKRKAFGPLPEGFKGDRLPVAFYFQPAR